jgi:hypothetical protein
MPTWQLEVVVWDRCVRQLRAVGDALAWRLFDFDRRFILALSRNAPPGPMVNTEGLDWELGAVQEAWANDGEFALLHDLTNSVRIGDMTVFTAAGPRIAEVKKSATSGGSRQREQVRRAQGAVDVINSGAPLRDGTELVIAPQSLKTNLPLLGRQLERAQSEAIASSSIAHQQVLTAIALTANVDRPLAELMVTTTRLKERAFAKAGLYSVAHHLRGVRADWIGLDPTLAPFTIYPFAPALVGALTADLVCFEYVIGWDRVARAFETRGFDVEVLLQEESGEVPADAAVLHDRRGDRRVTIHSAGLAQLLHELIDVDRYVAAVAGTARRTGTAARWASAVTFSNERATWR